VPTTGHTTGWEIEAVGVQNEPSGAVPAGLAAPARRDRARGVDGLGVLSFAKMVQGGPQAHHHFGEGQVVAYREGRPRER
jgi:hypothetical protein